MLFITHYAPRDEAQREGFAKRRLAYWVFTDEENERIPNFYTPPSMISSTGWSPPWSSGS
ncbi:hypothetical protein ACNPMX_07970 [Stenotrophomonas maltophilia]